MGLSRRKVGRKRDSVINHAYSLLNYAKNFVSTSPELLCAYLREAEWGRRSSKQSIIKSRTKQEMKKRCLRNVLIREHLLCSLTALSR